MGTHWPVKGKGPQLGTYFVRASISAEDEALLWKAYRIGLNRTTYQAMKYKTMPFHRKITTLNVGWPEHQLMEQKCLKKRCGFEYQKDVTDHYLLDIWFCSLLFCVRMIQKKSNKK